MAGNGVNLRQAPGTDAAVVARLSRGTILREVEDKGEWLRVEENLSARLGWVHRSLLAELRAATTATDNVILRGGAGKSHPILARLDRGTLVSRGEQQGEWVRVTVPGSGQSGFVHVSLLAENTSTARDPDRLRGSWQGQRTMADGSRYIGQFNGGVFDGQGILLFADGRKYTGGFKDGLFNGRGKMEMAMGGYDGEWQNGQFHGQGTLTRFDGSRLIGRWRDGSWVGDGKYVSPQGDVYEGEWQGTLFHGQGTMTFHDGRIQKGRWENGQYLGP
ncbi:MAG: SH3 domain-containing protein [Thermodesulfobacteriota bacterium]